jgi:hypothetical protein
LLVSAAGTVAAMIVFSLSGNIVLLSFLGFSCSPAVRC